MELIIEGASIPREDIINAMQKAAICALEREHIENDDAEISVTFTDADEIKEINREFRDMDAVTDVLSFPQFESPEDIPLLGHYSLGDVVICLEKAEEQGQAYGHGEDRELVYLFVHSVFHLLGYDHMEEDEKALMRRAEEEIMEKAGLPR